MDDLPIFPVIYFDEIVRQMSEEHIDVNHVLRECGLNPSVLSKPTTCLTLRQSSALITRYTGLSLQPYPGVRVGKRLDLVSHGIFGFVFCWQGDFREMLSNLMIYLRVRFPLMQIEVPQDSDWFGLRISNDPRLRDRDMGLFMIHAFVGSLVYLGRLVTRNVRVTVREEDFPELEPLRRLLDAEVGYGPVNEIRFYASSIKLPPPAAEGPRETHPTEDAVFQEQGFVLRMRNHIVEHMHDGASAETVAAAVGMSERTLRRRLAEMGLNFQDIRTDVRMQAAMRYLITTGVSIERIADLVGYADQASFTRAFREWSGSTPAEARKQKLGQLRRLEPEKRAG